MRKDSRILIAYDGSTHADAIWDDLIRAGLPERAEAKVVSVAERWLPRIVTEGEVHPENTAGQEAALTLAKKGASEIEIRFPSWEVSAEAAFGSPTQSILGLAQQWQADLIAIGSRGRTTWERMMMGSVFLKVAGQAPCSVRVARPHRSQSGHKPRLALAYDGLPGSDRAVQAVAERNWPHGTEVQLLTCVGFGYSPVANMSLAEDYDRARHIQRRAEAILLGTGLAVTPVVLEGDPKVLVAEEAESTHVDCVFLGNNDEPLVTRLLLGTVATAVASRVPCSVEIVR